MPSKSLRSEYLNSIEHYDFTADNLKSLLLYGIIVGVLIAFIFRIYQFVFDVKYGRYNINGHIRTCLSMCKRYKADTLLPIDKLSLKKVKESPFIGPKDTAFNPPTLECSDITFRFRAPGRLSFNEPDTCITIVTTVENTMR